ncbi:hypothetical protein [Actinoplanes sp. NPDC049681]|uniref:hypothetical protein n=1 Tax=Actinoplanes sp. NPDC049681 TaxID=3363905 RepID=UPI0037A331F0
MHPQAGNHRRADVTVTLDGKAATSENATGRTVTKVDARSAKKAPKKPAKR